MSDVDDADPAGAVGAPPVPSEATLRKAIERSTPKKQRDQCRTLLADLARELSDDSRGTLYDVLAAIVAAREREARPLQSAVGDLGMNVLRKIDKAEYRRSRERLEQQLFEVFDHQLLKSLPFHDDGSVHFYSFEEAVCPHGRWRRFCEETHSMLIRLPEATGERARFFRHVLAHRGVDPSTHSPDQFCSSIYFVNPDGGRTYYQGKAPATVPRRRRGRPRIPGWRDRLRDDVVAALTASGWPVTKSVEYLARIFRCCFGVATSPGALTKQLERRAT